MRAAIITGVLGALLASQSFAADKLAPEIIKTTFFTGQEFTAATPSGVKFKMVFTPDGKATRIPAANAGAKGEGTWKVTKEGFCTTWKNAKPNCFTIVAAGDNKWSVMKGVGKSPVLVAVWTK
jgi:hypothetical protein